jgi:mono/diheme cytochrome c family protein
LKAPREVKAFAAAAVAVLAAFGGAAGFAWDLRVRAARFSHQRPASESWPAPPPSPALIRQGRALFLHSCAHCHGLDAHGDEGPDLHDLQVSDRYIATTIKRGIRGEMPAFARKHSDRDITALLVYVRSLSPD